MQDATQVALNLPDRQAIHGMLPIAGGRFTMGSNRFYPEEGPARPIHVNPFMIDATPVTNRQFAAFVRATSYVTDVEIAPAEDAYPGLLAAMAVPGSIVFRPTSGPVSLDDPSAWWRFVPGAQWRHPLGKTSSIRALLDHPVVHVSWRDAVSYAHWAGKELPTEAEWECAAQGGLEGSDFAWGADAMPQGRLMANHWLGAFPWQNSKPKPLRRTSPVHTFPPNGFGLYDMIGNVWEWTADWFGYAEAPTKPCCVPRNPRGGSEAKSFSATPGLPPMPRKVVKGGSHLCAETYCLRYRPAARIGQTVDGATSHIGFRCVVRASGNAASVQAASPCLRPADR